MKKQTKRTPTKTFASNLFLRLYRIEKDYLLDDKIKLFMSLNKDGSIQINQSLGKRNLLGEGKVFEGDELPDSDTKWTAVLYPKNIHTEFVTDEGCIKVWVSFRYFEKSEPSVLITQSIPLDLLDEYPETFLGLGSSRTNTVTEVKDWINDLKEG